MYLTLFFVRISGNLIPKEINPNNYLPFNIPGLEILVALIFITLIGWLSLSFLGKKLFDVFELVLNKIPILRTIYSAVGQLTETFAKSKGDKKSVVLVEYPRKGVWAVAFISTETYGEIKEKINRGSLVTVFLPTTPNPTSGFMLFVPKDDIIILDMSVEDAAKLIISAGLIMPEKK